MKDVILLANESPNKPEIFYSIQGEGPQIGKPSVFIRVSNCNLYCSWCDTPYTWNWDNHDYLHDKNVKFNKEAESTNLSMQAVTDEISRYHCSRVIYTGGEPMLQQKRLSLLNKLLKSQRPFTIEVETNSTIVPLQPFDKDISLYVCSPKLSNSNVPENIRIKEEALKWFANSNRAVFKFVVATEKCIEEIYTLVKQFGIANEKVYLMCKAYSLEELNRNQANLTQLCLETGFNYSDRLHLRLYGDKRGT